MIWATVSFRSCFCRLYTASPSLATKNVINLICILTIWWCPCVKSSLVLLKKSVCNDQWILLEEFNKLLPALFCSLRPNLPVTPGISWLLTFAFQSPMMKRTSFFDVSSSRSCGRRQCQPTPVLLPGKSHGQRATVHGVAKSWTRLSYFTFTFHFHALEKEMATHSESQGWGSPVGCRLWGRTELDTTEAI